MKGISALSECINRCHCAGWNWPAAISLYGWFSSLRYDTMLLSSRFVYIHGNLILLCLSMSKEVSEGVIFWM